MTKDVELDVSTDGGNISTVPHLKIKNGSEEYSIKLYDTVEATGHQQADVSTLPVHIGEKTYYARMTHNLSGACGGDTPLRVKKGGTIYQVTQYGEFIANPVANLYVFDDNANTFVKRDYGWIGDGESAYYEIHWSDSGSNSNFNYIDVTIPKNCSVVRLEGYGGQTSNNAINVRVTPGKTYRIVAWRYEKQENRTLWTYESKMSGGHVIGHKWVSYSQNYYAERCRQLVFTYTNFKNDGTAKTIIITNADTHGAVTSNENRDIGTTDATWGNAGFMRVCFGKGNYNYEANFPQDTML